MAAEQRLLHIVTEALAIPFAIFLFWLATRKRKLFRWEKVLLWVAGIANIVIDGFLILTWLGVV